MPLWASLVDAKAVPVPLIRAVRTEMRQGGMQPAHSLRRTHHRGLPACGTNNSRRLKEAKAVIKDLSAWLDFPELRVVNGQLVASTKIIPKPSVMRQQILRGSLLLHPTNLLLGEACLDYCDWLRNTHNDHSPDYLSSSASFLRYSRFHSDKYDLMARNLYTDIVRAHVKRKEYKEAQTYMDCDGHLAAASPALHPQDGRGTQVQAATCQCSCHSLAPAQTE
ncbi:hypothetical protein RvY_18119-1 [Ramazzottius varieornatus]|uniref:Uncharacterized protein n=1 Tax=Ramazzottius varieornatus TaxID=947166 RepID=A0A1D1WAN3_RAMVA|nr:hypothetical protein RvY_18119-1 [Ramazzottius varieornatus]